MARLLCVNDGEPDSRSFVAFSVASLPTLSGNCGPKEAGHLRAWDSVDDVRHMSATSTELEWRLGGWRQQAEQSSAQRIMRLAARKSMNTLTLVGNRPPCPT